jgi:hypothetical protein
MAVVLPHYAKIKDRYCIGYFGRSNEYLVQLLLLRPNIEKELPGIQVYIACMDEVFHLLDGHPNVLTYSQLRENELNFAYIRNLTCDLQSHPVEVLMEESQIPLSISVPEPPPGDYCLISPEGVIPTKSLTAQQIDRCRHLARDEGLEVEVGNNFQGAAWVIGVENEFLFAAAARGIQTALVPTGLGTKLYQNMFERAEVLELPA